MSTLPQPLGQNKLSYILQPIVWTSSILSTRDLILQSPWAPPHTLSCLAKCHCTPRKHSTSGPTPSWFRAESLRSKSTLKVPAKLVPWLWRTPGPGDAALTGEIIMFYPSLTPLSVTRMRTDKCSDGKTHSCSIYLFSLVPASSSFQGTTLGPAHTRYMVPTTMCCPLVKCQAALSYSISPGPAAPRPFR